MDLFAQKEPEKMSLTHREDQILEFTAHGYTPDEVGILLGIARETVRKVLCKIKLKLKLQKSTELVAYYWCEIFGTTLQEQRKNILKAMMCIYFLLTIPIEHEDKRRMRLRTRRNEVEYMDNHFKSLII